MGKYIRKSKIETLMDVSPSSSSLGVLTRAKSLALQRRLQKPSLPTSPNPPPSKRNQKVTDCGSSYLQLRSRRLQKQPPILLIRSSKQRRRKDSNPNPKSASVAESGKEKVSNLLELQGSSESLNRNTLKGDAEIITSLEASTKLNNSTSDNSDQREESSHRPNTPDMDRFFSGAEEEQQKQFIEKYNFDPVNEQPLPGRFEWEKVN